MRSSLSLIVGTDAFQALCRETPLVIWRGSTPHNWYIERTDGSGFLWHSEPGEPKPCLSMFTKENDSRELVRSYWGKDSGLPIKTVYILKKEFR